MRRRFGMWASAALLSAVPCAAQLPNPLDMTTDPADRAVMAEVATAVSSRTPDIAQLNAILLKLPRPTPLRGMVQTVRAGVLQAAQDIPGAVSAIQEALRLLPDDPRPKLVASAIFTFSGSPQRAADLWVEASREAPDIARTGDRYFMSALVGRLTDLGDNTRADRLRARMGEIGFSTELADERSGTQLARTREAVRAGRIDEAFSDVTAIGNPGDLLTLYVDRRYTSLWPRIGEWAGQDLSAQTARYLEELRSDWTAADDFKTATPYARRLAELGAHSAVIGLFLPMFERLPAAPGQEAEFLAPVVARSLLLTGRDAEAQALLGKLATAMVNDKGGNALNVDGAYLIQATLRADWLDVIGRADTFLVKARAFGSGINQSAVTQVEAWRACALWKLNRTAEAQQSTAQVLLSSALAPAPIMNLQLCRGDMAAARMHVIARLADETTRDWALAFVQPVRDVPLSPLDRIMKPAAQIIRNSPDVIAAANKVGRVLPKPVADSVPPSFDPFRVKHAAPTLAPGST